MKRVLAIMAFTLAMTGIGGCDADRMSEKGFSLPEGNALAGQQAFVYLHCYECHSIDKVELPANASGQQAYVELGGKVSQVRTYGQLVTSIINPSHKLAAGYPADLITSDGQSKMPLYNSYMTVQELIDIVAFLQPHYEVTVPKFYYQVYP